MARLKSNLVDFALEEITRRINNYDYSSGAIISEVALAEELKISRTPIREAILKLIDIGILERTSTKVVVKAINLSDIHEIMQVREAIELMAAKIIIKAGGLSTEQFSALNSINENIIKSISEGDFEKNFEQDCSFHEKLVEYAGNTRLIDICKRLNIQSRRFRWITMLTPARYSNTVDEHKMILEGMLRNDIELASDALSAHVRQTYNNYKYILRDDKWINMMRDLKGVN